MTVSENAAACTRPKRSEPVNDVLEFDVMDADDYRLLMRAGGPAATGRSYYLVGLTHTIRRGGPAVDRDQRLRLADTIRARYPHAVVRDPVETWYAGGDRKLDGPPALAEFHRLTGLAAGSEVCVAWLPDRDSVADSVAELQVARRGGSTVVAITDAADDLMVRAFASVVVPDLAAFDRWVQVAA